MIARRMDSNLPEEQRAEPLDDVRNLQITYSRLKPGAGTCFVEHAGGRIEVFEVDTFLIERLLDHLEHREA
jgi:hypothetical protein